MYSSAAKAAEPAAGGGGTIPGIVPRTKWRSVPQMVVLAIFSVIAGWQLILPNILEQSRPLGPMLRGLFWDNLVYPAEVESHRAMARAMSVNEVNAALLAARERLAGNILLLEGNPAAAAAACRAGSRCAAIRGRSPWPA